MNRKMRITGAAWMLSCLLLFGCGQKAATLNVTETARVLAEQGTYEDELNESTSSIFEMLYYGVDMSTVEEVAFYISTGATAEEIMIARCTTEAAAEALLSVAQERVDYLKSSFESYIPKEVPKIEAAVLQQKGCYVVLCISADSEKASSLLKGQWID